MVLGLKVRRDKQAGSNKLILFYFQKEIRMRVGYNTCTTGKRLD